MNSLPYKYPSFKVGVLAATYFDTQAGVEYLKKSGINAFPYFVSKSPMEQTRLQINQVKLMEKVINGIDYLTTKGAHCIFIYCNSLSGALDLEKLRMNSPVPIITRLEVYVEVARNFHIFGLLAANCQSLAHIENIIIRHNPKAVVIGLGSLALVDAIEEGESPADIVKEFNLIQICEVFKIHHCENIIFGCTHFPYFLDEFSQQMKENHYNFPIIEPSQKMLEHLNEIKTVYITQQANVS